eukprot:scaffold26312_cov74-Phaeocystis_antarctica.AAC.1
MVPGPGVGAGRPWLHRVRLTIAPRWGWKHGRPSEYVAVCLAAIAQRKTRHRHLELLAAWLGERARHEAQLAAEGAHAAPAAHRLVSQVKEVNE